MEDARAAASAGADAIGMIFHAPAPRNISVERAREIVAALPPFVTPVGVFVDAGADQIMEMAAAVGVGTVQLNGSETFDFVAKLSLRVIKAIRVDSRTIPYELDLWRRSIAVLKIDNLVGLVLEPSGTGQAGGSGVANDWKTVRRLIDKGSFNGLPPLIAAGGLTPENVADVIRSIHPSAVDVSSGVEESKGIKSADKIAAFIDAVRSADR